MDAGTHTAGGYAPTQPCRRIGPGVQQQPPGGHTCCLLGCRPRPQLSALAHNTMARTDRALYQLGEARRGRVTGRHSPRPAAHARVGRSQGYLAGCGLRTGHRTLFTEMRSIGCCQHMLGGADGTVRCQRAPAQSKSQPCPGRSAGDGHRCWGRNNPNTFEGGTSAIGRLEPPAA